MTEDDIVSHVRECVKEFERYSSDWRAEAKDSFEFAAGRQWNSDDLAYLKEQNRPVVTFNRIGKFIDAIVGTEVNNKMEWKYSVGDVSDTAAVDLLSSTVKQLTAKYTEGETTAAFRDAVTCGYGWTDTRVNYLDSIEGRIVEEHVDPFQVGWDPDARMVNLIDARWVFRVKRYTKDQLEEEWPGASDKATPADETALFKEDVGDTSIEERGEYDFLTADSNDVPLSGKYIVICFQEMVVREEIVAVNPLTRQQERLTPEQFSEIEKKLSKIGLSIDVAARNSRTMWSHSYVCGSTLLAVHEVPCRTLECMTGKWDRNKRYCYGIVRAGKDPQLWENKLRSNIMHNISSTGKGVLVEEDAIAANDWRKFEQDWARPDKIKRLAPGAISQGKIKTPDPVPLPAGLAELLSHAAAAVPDTLGISPEFLGLAGRTQSGVVERSRRQAGLSVISEMFQARRIHIQRTGAVKIAIVTNYMPDSVFLRVGGPTIAPLIPALRQADFAQYDVSVDEAPVSPDQKAEVWADFLQIAPMIIPMRPPVEVWLAAMEYSPLPASLVRKLAEALQQPNPQQQQSAQLELQQQAADLAETQSKAMLNTAKAQSEGSPDLSNVLSTQAQAHKAAMEAGFREQEHAMKMRELGAKFISSIAEKRAADA